MNEARFDQEVSALVTSLGGSAIQKDKGHPWTIYISTPDGRRVSISLAQNGAQVTCGVRVDGSGERSGSITLRPANDLDRLWIRTFGWRRKTGDHSFDGVVHGEGTLADSQYRALFSGPAARAAALALLGSGGELVLAGTMASWRTDAFKAPQASGQEAGPGAAPDEAAVRDAVGRLCTLQDALLESMAARSLSKVAEEATSWIVIGWVMSTMLAYSLWRPLDYWPLLGPPVLLAVLWPLLVALRTFMRRGDSLRDDRMLRNIAIAVTWGPLLAWGFFGLNAWLGEPAVENRDARVVDVALFPGIVTVRSWRPGHQTESFWPGKATKDYSVGATVRFPIRQGLLWPWAAAPGPSLSPP